MLLRLLVLVGVQLALQQQLHCCLGRTDHIIRLVHVPTQARMLRCSYHCCGYCQGQRLRRRRYSSMSSAETRTSSAALPMPNSLQDPFRFLLRQIWRRATDTLQHALSTTIASVTGQSSWRCTVASQGPIYGGGAFGNRLYSVVDADNAHTQLSTASNPKTFLKRP